MTVRDSFTIVRHCTIARPGSAAWAVELQGPTAPGVAVMLVPTTNPPAAVP